MSRPVTPPSNKETPTLFTKGDKELQSILDLHQASRRLENVIKEVQLFIDTVNDDRISRKSIESKSKVLQRYVIPAMEKTISQESRQRAKSLTHQYQVDLRQKHYEEIQSERKRVEDSKRAKIENQITTVMTIREKLNARLRLTISASMTYLRL
jgi:hypothetical protein